MLLVTNCTNYKKIKMVMRWSISWPFHFLQFIQFVTNNIFDHFNDANSSHKMYSELQY